MIEKKAKIVPDKSLYGKLSHTGYSLEQAISELIDNAIDERIEGELLTIEIKLEKDSLSVMDDGRGMDEETAISSVVLGKSKKKNKLGEFGLGLKTASLSIGDKFTVYTTRAGDPNAYIVPFDKEEWENRPDMDWDNFPYNTKKKQDINSHGTTIKIDRIKIRLYGRVTDMRKKLAKRYAPFIKNNEVIIKVNNKYCEPVYPDLIPDSKKEFSITTTLNYKIYGWYGLLKEGSMKGAYGFDTFRRGRLITVYDKIGIGEHPTLARIVGEIHMDDVPVTHDKREWEKESAIYKDVEKALKKELKEIVAKSRKLASRKKIKKKVKEERDNWLDNIAEAIKDPTIKYYFKPKTPDKTMEASSEDIGTVNDSSKTTKLEEVEKRNPGDTHGTSKPTGTRSREPKKTHEVERSVNVRGKKFKFTHKYAPLGEAAGWKEYSINSEQVIEILTNTDFPAFVATKDQAYYAAYHIAETLAEIIVKEADEDSSNVAPLKEQILRNASRLMVQVSEDNSK